MFRSEVLRLKPELLDTLLAKATTGHDEVLDDFHGHVDIRLTQS